MTNVTFVQTGKNLQQDCFNITCPFHLRVQHKTSLLCCHKIIEIVPHKMLIAAGTWQQKSVVAKIFLSKNSSSRAAYDELSGLHALIKAGFHIPEIYCIDALYDEDIYVILSEPIASGVKRLDDHLENLSCMKAKNAVIEKLMVLLAEIHAAGIIKKDIRLRDFSVDTKGMHITAGSNIIDHQKPIAEKPSIKNLAMLLATTDYIHIAIIEKFYGTYMNARQWSPSDSDLEYLLAIMAKKRKSIRNKFAQSTFNNTDRWIVSKTRQEKIAYMRNYDIDELRKLIAKFGTTPLLKAGRSSSIINTTLHDKDIIIKRYNIKNWHHGLQRSVQKTRAENSWQNAHILLNAKINTARPLAYIVETKNKLRKTSYFFMEHVTGYKLLDYMKQHQDDNILYHNMISQIVDLFERMAHAQICHGDLKHSNFIVHHDMPFIIDLDGMKQMKSTSGFRRCFRKDMARFLGNFEQDTKIHQDFESAIAPILR